MGKYRINTISLFAMLDVIEAAIDHLSLYMEKAVETTALLESVVQKHQHH